jgi:type I restriction enzyme, S subunit
MSLQLKPYPEYKESGVTWPGTVPKHWELVKMKYLFRERSIKGYPNEPLLAATQTLGVVPKDHYDARTVLATKDLHLLKLVLPGDFVISLRSFQGGIEFAGYRGIISPAYTILALDHRAVPEYFVRLFKSKPFVKNLSMFVTGIRQGQNIDYGRLSRQYLPLPSYEEQQRIATFIACVDRVIKRLIRAKRRLIELLNEQKQAIIHQAVTRGLDPNVRLKPSGVDWLGDVPEHWKVKRLGHFITLQRGFDITKDQQIRGQIPVVSSGGVASYHNQYTSKGPGVLIGRKGSVGSVHFAESSYWAHDTTLWVKEFNHNHPKFIYYFLRTLELKKFDTGSANPTLNRNIIHPEPVCLPPTGEQVSIASFLDSVTTQLEQLINNAMHQIDLLREYRTRLISDIVTGKLDVTGVKIEQEDGETDFLEDFEENEAEIVIDKEIDTMEELDE